VEILDDCGESVTECRANHPIQAEVPRAHLIIVEGYLLRNIRNESETVLVNGLIQLEHIRAAVLGVGIPRSVGAKHYVPVCLSITHVHLPSCSARTDALVSL
jgi:hypothetical protein